MKFYHYTIIFIIIALSFILIHNYSVQEKQAVERTMKSLERTYDSAVDDAVIHLVSNENSMYVVHKEEAVQAFLNSFATGLGVMDNPGAKEQLENYIPCILITAEDGFYLYYADKYVDSYNNTNIVKRYSEKIPYAYEDDWFYYQFTLEDTVILYDKENKLANEDDIRWYRISYHDVKSDERFEKLRQQYPNCILFDNETYELTKKQTIANVIQENMTYIVNAYNEIAFKNGISYQFHMPEIDNSEWMRTMESPSLLVIFQGYPIKGTSKTFQRFTVSQAVINRKNAYYIEPKEWFRIYHKADCTHFTPTEETITFYSRKECSENGAFACEECFPKNR